MLQDLFIGVPALLGALCFLVASAAVARTGDALTRINVLSVATGIGMAFFVCAAFAHEVYTSGFSWTALFMALVAIGANVVVTTVASVILARAVYRSGARLDPRTGYDDLAE